MAYTARQKTRILMGDPSGVFSIDDTELSDLLDRGVRDFARRGVLIQKRESIDLTANTRVYTLSNDHVDTFSMFREFYSTSVRILSQDAYVWFLMIEPDTGLLQITDQQPAGNILLSTPDTYWLEITSPDTTTWYVYPDVTGVLIVSTVQPGTGSGTASTVQLRDHFGVPWYLSVDDMGSLSMSMSGSATLTATALADQAMQRVEPEAIERIDARATSGAPNRYAIAGKLLYLHPTPDAAYQIDHKYFSDDTSLSVDAAQHLSPLFTTALILQRKQRLVAAQQVLGMYRAEMDMLALNLFPGSRDGLSVYRMPERM